MKYREATIKPTIYSGYEWHHDSYADASFEDNDNWVTFGMGHRDTIEGCKEDIDEMFEELKVIT